MAVLTTFRHKFWDDAGIPLSGGKVYTYSPGTTTPLNSYTDSTGITPNSNPVILDAKGEADIWTVGMFKVNVTTSADVQVTGYPVDNLGYDITLQSYATAIHGATNKVTPNASDETGIWDSITGLFNKLTIGNLLGGGLPGIFSSVVASGTVTMATATTGGHGVNFAQFNALVQNKTATAFTTGGTSTAYTLTPIPAIAAYAANQTFDVIFNAACGASPTLAISGLGTPPNLVRQLTDGTYTNLTANSIVTGWQSHVKLVSITQALVMLLPKRSVVISSTRIQNAVTGSVSYTGVGFKPSKITITGVIAGAAGFTIGSASLGGMNFQIFTNDATLRDIGTTTCFSYGDDTDGTQRQSATLTSFDVDGFTLAWTKAGAGTPSGTIKITIRCEE